MPLRRDFIYLCSADSKRLAACAFRHKLSAFLCHLCCPHWGTLCAKEAGWTPTQLPSAAQRYNTLDFVTKVVCHETPARFLWILPAQRAGRPLMTILSILLQDGLAKRESHPLINSQSQREIFGIFIKPKTALHSGRRAVIFDPGYIPPHLPGDTVKSHRAYSRYG